MRGSRRLAEEELLKAWMGTPLVITFVVQSGAFVSFNHEFARATGYGSSNAIEPSSLVYPADKSLVRTRATGMLKKRSVAPYEYRGITKTGEVRWLREAVTLISYRGKPACLATTLDITEEKLGLGAASDLRPEHTDLVDIVQEPIGALDADGRLVACNLAMSDLLRTPRPDLTGRRCSELFQKVSESAAEWLSSPQQWSAFSRSFEYQSADRWFEISVGPAAQPTPGGYAYVMTIKDTTASKRLEEQINARERLLEDAGNSLFLHGRRMLLDSFHHETNGETAQGTAENHTREWSHFLTGSIEAMTAAAESRDLYAVGHAKYVARMACAIGKEMGLEAKRIDGLDIAALLSDLGKIAVPSEFLMKPGRLTDSEYSVVKAHSQVGFYILQPIAFPWPVAEIVLQHHEMFDGSGYPKGLAGEDILLDARILAVAERVVAMLSPRSYRTALKPDAIIDQAARWNGGNYDPAVVKAAVKVIKEGSAVATS
ncbi:MAG: PAS domain S-box protein [Dehalococcoidia bacterium]|nr:PAS domain S-box protein [Dehalococcoidia bacterium]